MADENELEVIVHEVQFQEVAESPEEYANIITQLYDAATSMLSYIRVSDASDALVGDLSGRTFEYKTQRGRPLKALVDKETFRKQNGRSPDDGDGFVLAVSPEHLFSGSVNVGFA